MYEKTSQTGSLTVDGVEKRSEAKVRAVTLRRTQKAAGRFDGL